MNSFSATGRLTRDPDLKLLPNDDTVCEIRIAMDSPKGPPDYIDVAEYGPAGEAAAEVLSKGWLVAINGRIQYREWKAKDGSSRSAHRVVGHIEFLSAPKATNTNADANVKASA